MSSGSVLASFFSSDTYRNRIIVCVRVGYERLLVELLSTQKKRLPKPAASDDGDVSYVYGFLLFTWDDHVERTLNSEYPAGVSKRTSITYECCRRKIPIQTDMQGMYSLRFASLDHTIVEIEPIGSSRWSPNHRLDIQGCTGAGRSSRKWAAMLLE